MEVNNIKFIDKKTKNPTEVSDVAKTFLSYLFVMFISTGENGLEFDMMDWKAIRGLKTIEETKKELKRIIKELENVLILWDGEEYNIFKSIKQGAKEWLKQV